MVEVVLYGPLRDTVGEKRHTVDGDTVGAALEELYEAYPELRSAVYEDGAFRSEINVFVDGRKLATLNGLETTLDGSETVQLTAAMSGGDR